MAGDEQPTWRGAERVLAVRLDNVGDVVMLGPALRALRQALPDARLTLLASPAGARAAELLPWVDDVVVLRAVWQDASSALPLDPAREEAVVERLRALRADAAFVFTSFTQSPWPPAYACYLAGIPYRAGQSTDFGGSLLTDAVTAAPASGHQVDRNLHLLASVGVPLAGDHLEVAVPPAADARAGELLRAAGIDPDGPFVVAAPGASAASRRYPPARLASAMAQVSAAGVPVVVVGSERERDVVAPVAEAADASLAGATTVPELAAVLARAALVVCNNSGPLHLADALGRPVVALYSGSELESQWRPRRVPARLLRVPTACSPCHRFECPTELECLDIDPRAVADACLELLRRSPVPATTRAS